MFLSHRYAQLVSVFFVNFAFMTSIPILGLLGMASFFVSYWVDKFLFTRYYLSAIRYPHSVGVQATAFIPYAVIAHLILAIWSLSSSSAFVSGSNHVEYQQGERATGAISITDSVAHEYTFQLFILLIVVVTLHVLKWCIYNFAFGTNYILSHIKGDWIEKYNYFYDTARYEKEKLDISYQRAVKRGYIFGLDTYNILVNPRYKEAFGITEEFGRNHRRVRSIAGSARGSNRGSAVSVCLLICSPLLHF